MPSAGLSWLSPRTNPFALFRITVVVLSAIHAVSAVTTPIRLATSPGYRGRDPCPARCSDSGPVPGNWSLYHNLEQFESCQESIFLDFSLYDAVDDPAANHRIYACTSYGPDWENLPANKSALASLHTVPSTNATYQVGWWPEAPGTMVAGPLSSLTHQLRSYLDNGFASSKGPFILVSKMGPVSVGIYIGAGLQRQGIGSVALQYLQTSLSELDASLASSVAMQFCEHGQTANHVFGLIATGNTTFYTVQNALTSWSRAKCLTFPKVQNFTASLPLVTPLYKPSNITSNSTRTNHSTIASTARGASLAPRTTCSTVQVVSGDSCGSLASQCGITPAQFTQYNPEANECSTLQPGEHVCCSAGTLPDFAPKPNADGSCATYTIQANDNCADLAAEYSLTIAEINEYNNDTWAWSGCADIWTGTIICLSSGTPPMPAALSNAVCGPQVPGTPVPLAGTNISDLNPCPLNACCDVWGQCGTTSDFCTNTGTGAPGTARPGTNGCISNCGTELVRSGPPSTYRSVGYFEGFNLERPCLYQTVSQIDASQYTHLYFSFGTLSPSYEVEINGTSTNFEFQQFLQMRGPLRILSIGGWAFSTDPSTYMIFREGVTSANRMTMAQNIANFVNQNYLDGVNIDWEYPGAPDIPGIPPASTDDGANYLAFLVILKNLLPGKEITIAAPASYWYLKGFPIAEMSKIVDYIIYMTYDLHGQWDSGNQWSQLGCPTGTCLRTDVNLTETMGALVMITKAGVPSNQVVVGVTSYGRSFAMAEAGCYGPECTYLGSADDSQAAPGPCTQTPGYIANAEILAILANSSRVNQNFIDPGSNTNILVYDNVQWVGWMSNGVKAERTSMYQGLDMGGTTDWATDLAEYNSPPGNVNSWATFVEDATNGQDPFAEGTRTGNWTTLTCEDPAVQDAIGMTPEERWGVLDCTNAWTDSINVWFNDDQPSGKGISFTESIMNTIHGPEDAQCGDIAPQGNCDSTETCSEFSGFGSSGESGPAAYEIFNSFVEVNAMYSQLFNAINSIAGTYIDSQLGSFEDTFAPVPPAPSDEWLLILINLLGLGLTAVAAPFFDGVFGALPALEALGDAGADVVKDVTYATLAFGAAIASAAIPPSAPGQWTPQSQDSFSAYMGQVLLGWTAVTQNQLWNLFNGSTPSVNTLGTLINKGYFIEGSTGAPNVPYSPTSETTTQVENYISKAFFGYAIPAVWTASGTAAFVIDSGYPCSAQNPLSSYMTDDTQEATYSCYNNNLYYLVYPNGPASTCEDDVKEDCVGCTPPPCEVNKFVAPPGLSDLTGGDAWGGITRDQLIQGSVNTYVANGNANNGPAANPLDTQTIQDLQQQDITTPGYIRLPVCSASVAFSSWSTPSQSNSSAPGYPCNPLQGITKCSGYTYTDETSSASAKVSDCQDIINNIQGTSGEWTTGIGGQRDIASSGTCNFGVQNSGTTGDVTFYTGSQDVVTIIAASIKQFSSNGLVGAKGYMECGGDAGGQKVEWGLY